MRSARLFLLLLAGALLAGAPAAAKDDWLPISPEELAMKEYPAAAGADAMVLWWESYFDHVRNYEEQYKRVKIFTEKGRRYADIEILHGKNIFGGLVTVEGIRARTIRPDGSVVEFSGEILDKVITSKRGWMSVRAKTFTLPEVTPGCIIEYKYKRVWPPHLLGHTTGIFFLPGARWDAQDELFIRRLQFSFRPVGDFALAWTFRLPAGREPRQDKDGIIWLEMENVPALVREEYMPPQDWLAYYVQFFYRGGEVGSVEEFWEVAGKKWNEAVEKFVGRRKAIEQGASELTSPGDPPVAKLRKLYTRVQQIRNLTYERLKTEQEEKREGSKDNKNVEDVLKNGYGYSSEINRLFVALARGAGFDAGVVRLAERDEVSFDKSLLDSYQLRGEVTVVQLEGKELYLDPGTPLCPFGLLAWQKSGVTGLRLDSNGGVFVKTPVPEPGQGLIERQAELTLDAEGTLEGTLRVTFHGQQALERRAEQRDADEAARRKQLEDEVKAWLPAAAEVELQQMSGWETAEEPLRAEFHLRLPGFATPTGRRLLLPLGVFQSQERHPFQHAQRSNPVYFRYPFQEMDDVSVELPEGYGVESLPAKQDKISTLGRYQFVSQNQPGTVRLERRLAVDGFFFRTEYYSLLRSFYDAVRKGDESQVVLRVEEGK